MTSNDLNHRESPPRGFCQNPQLGAFARIMPSPTRPARLLVIFGCKRCFPLRTRPRGRHAMFFFTFGCERPRVWVFNSARALLNTHTRGRSQPKVKKNMACRPRGRVRSGKHRLQPKITRRRAGLVGEGIILAKAPSWGF